MDVKNVVFKHYHIKVYSKLYVSCTAQLLFVIILFSGHSNFGTIHIMVPICITEAVHSRGQQRSVHGYDRHNMDTFCHSRT